MKPSKEERALLDSLTPDPEIVDRYISRKVSKAQILDLDLLSYAMDRKVNVLLKGPTGPGKTMLCMAFAASEGLPFFAVPCHGGAELSTTMGRRYRDKDGMWPYRYAPVPLIQRHGGVILWDEVNFLPPKIAAYVHPMLDKRRQLILTENDDEVIPAHDETLHIAAYNPGYRNTYKPNEAFLNRFGIQITWDYDPEVERQLVASPTLRKIAQNLRDQPEIISTPVSTNMLDEFERIVEDLGLTYAIYNFVEHFVTGHEREAVSKIIELEADNLRGEYAKGLGRNPDRGLLLEGGS